MKSQALLLGFLFLLGVGFQALIQWGPLSESSELTEVANLTDNQNSSDEKQVIQDVAAYLEKNPEQVPKLQNPQEAQAPIRFVEINLSDPKDFAADNVEGLKNLVMKACQDNPDVFINSIKTQFNSLSSDRSEERVRLLEVAKLSVAYLPPESMKEVFLVQADKYNSVPGTDDFVFGAKALQAYFDTEPDNDKRNKALSRIGHMEMGSD